MQNSNFVNTNSLPTLNLERDLNEEQRAAVTFIADSSLVIAGAGSGKTRVLTYKVAYLLTQGYNTWNVLALTFTNKAAREMNNRIEQLLGTGTTRNLWSGTFHSIFARILRREAHKLGYNSNFTIYDTTDQTSLVKSIVKDLALDDKTYKASRIIGRISSAKNRLVLPDAYKADRDQYNRNKAAGIPEIGHIYSVYQQRLKRSNAMDFDDLLLNTFLLLRNHEDVHRHYAERFRYILVDEYQDTNYAQHCIVYLLAQCGARVCVVGDDAQSIYSFRGAKIENILHFQQQYPGAKLFKLERNYRSTKKIVAAANSIIDHNSKQIKKTVYSEEGEGSPLTIIQTYSDKEEAIVVASAVERLYHRDHIPLSEIALLYRTNAQSRSLEDSLRERGLPYRIYGSLSFYQRKEIKDLLAYFRLIYNPHDDEAFRRVVNFPARGIGQTTLLRLRAAATKANTSLWSVTERPDEFQVGISASTISRLHAFMELIAILQTESQSLSAYALACNVLEITQLKNELSKDDTPEGQSKRENVDELLGAVKNFEDDRREQTGQAIVPLSEYLANVSLLTDADRTDDGSPKITLLTVHAAKGLEFDTVFITGMEDGLFPSGGPSLTISELEEERRLFYVAVTRAKRHCFLTYTRQRFRYGRMEPCEPSTFLSEIDPSCVVTRGKQGRTSTRASSPLFNNTPTAGSTFPTSSKCEANRAFFTSPGKKAPLLSTSTPRLRSTGIRASSEFREAQSIKHQGRELRIGSCVHHERFGNGVVTKIEEAGISSKATIDFEHIGTKTLLLKFARITICD